MFENINIYFYYKKYQIPNRAPVKRETKIVSVQIRDF